MKNIVRVTSLVLCLILCMSMAVVSVSAAENEGYVEITDAQGEYMLGYYDLGTTLVYYPELYILDTVTDDYLESEILDTDTIELYRVTGEDRYVPITAVRNGNTVSWTPDESGVWQVEIRLIRGADTYYGMEVYQIGTPWVLEETSEIICQEELLYTGKSLIGEVAVYFAPTGRLLEKNVDYKLTMSNDKGPGKCTITVTGIGKCKGTLTKTVNIISPSTKFSDVKQNAWYVGAINYALYAKLFNGTSGTTFEPNANMTRGMFVTVIGRLCGFEQLPQLDNRFVDVDPKMYYARHVAWAYAFGIVNGVDQSHFAPNDPITREQMCTMISRLNDFMGEEVFGIDLQLAAGGAQFKDHQQISSWARNAVYGCRNAAIVNGKPGNIYDPKGLATRAEVATIFKNYVTYLGEALLNSIGEE